MSKKTLARNMMTQREISSHTPPFNSIGWMTHKQAIKKRVEKTIARQKAAAERRRLERERLKKEQEAKK